MRLAWFSPLPPTRSGIAAYTVEIVPRIAGEGHLVERFDERTAHDFVWKARRDPYDLVVYQLGNAPCHDYMWAYLAAYPGLVVLHDARLHHARARRLLQSRRAGDYRREFAYDHPDARADVAEYAVEGLGGPIYYFWSMIRVVVRTARLVAVHNARVAEDLRAEFPGAPIDAIRMGVPSIETSDAERAAVRLALGVPEGAVLFAAFGKVTAEKRVEPMLRALAAIVASGRDAHLALVGDADGCASLGDDIARHGVGDRVHVTGHVDDDRIGAYLGAADACLCLRWPTARETSASWLRCLAAGRATVITDLAHLVDVPAAVALRVDLLDEERALIGAMQRLVDDPALRDRLGRAGRDYWSAHHTLDAMASDYGRVLAAAAVRPAPRVPDLPRHFTDDYTEPAREVARRFGVGVDLFD